jgi:hypothetical protein
MRLSGLVVAFLLLVSPLLFAQHSSGGGSSSGGSSGGSSSSGGSHGYSGGSSSASSSSGGHSSGGSASSGGHSSGSRGTGGTASRASGAGSTARQPIGNNARVQGGNVAEHRGFFAFLRHPFRKPEPTTMLKTAAVDLVPPVCKGKACVCPPGVAGKNGGCTSGVTSVVSNQYRRCQSGEYWDGAGCNGSSLFRPDDCGSLSFALDRQAEQSRLAESSRQTSCSRDSAAQECSELTARAQVETARYQSLLEQYQQCRRQTFRSFLGP